MTLNILNAPTIDSRPWVVIRSCYDDGKRIPLMNALAPSVGHETEELAMDEAHRLALTHPGALFHVARLTNGYSSEVLAFPLKPAEEQARP